MIREKFILIPFFNRQLYEGSKTAGDGNMVNALGLFTRQKDSSTS